MGHEPAAVERDLAAYYDQEAAERAVRAIDPQRVVERKAFVPLVSSPLLEIGTGPGRDAEAFVAAGVDVVGVDLSFEHARRAGGVSAAATVASVRALPFADGAFAAGWSMSTLMHVPDVAIVGALDEVRRVLAPGAPMAVGVWGGADVEAVRAEDIGGPPRLFSRRSDERWRDLLGRIGTVERFERWDRDGDFWYQFAVVRRGEG
jgi:SAM-dependent methyltransferase